MSDVASTTDLAPTPWGIPKARLEDVMDVLANEIAESVSVRADVVLFGAEADLDAHDERFRRLVSIRDRLVARIDRLASSARPMGRTAA